MPCFAGQRQVNPSKKFFHLEEVEGTLHFSILPAFFIAPKCDLDVHLNDLVALQLLVKSHPSAGHQVVCPSFFAAQWTGRRSRAMAQCKILVLAGSYGLND